MTDLCACDAITLAGMLRRREVSAREVIAAHIERAEAVVDQETGIVVERPKDPGAVAVALRRLLSDEPLRRRMGNAARERAVACFNYANLAPRLAEALAQVGG